MFLQPQGVSAGGVSDEFLYGEGSGRVRAWRRGEPACVRLHGPGLPPRWDPGCRPPHHLLCLPGHTTLDDGLELHVVVDVGVGVGGLHRLQTGLVHWGRGPGVCRVGVQSAGVCPPLPPLPSPTLTKVHSSLTGCCLELLLTQVVTVLWGWALLCKVGGGGGCSGCAGSGAFLHSDPHLAPGSTPGAGRVWPFWSVVCSLLLCLFLSFSLSLPLAV